MGKTKCKGKLKKWEVKSGNQRREASLEFLTLHFQLSTTFNSHIEIKCKLIRMRADSQGCDLGSPLVLDPRFDHILGEYPTVQ